MTASAHSDMITGAFNYSRYLRDLVLVTVKGIEGVFSPEQKRQLIRRLTDVMVEIEAEKLRPITWVIIIEDVKSGDWGIGGNALTLDDARALQSGAVAVRDAIGAWSGV
jgi:4-oxalocrotonate tautomerase